MAHAAADVRKDGGGVAEEVAAHDELVHLEGRLLHVGAYDLVGDHLAALEDVLHQHAVEGEVHILQREQMAHAAPDQAVEPLGRMEGLQRRVVARDIHLNSHLKRDLMER